MKLRIREAGRSAAFLVAAADPFSDPAQAAGAAYRQITAALNARKWALFHERIFGSLSAHPAVIAARRAALESAGIRSDTPLTFIEGAPPWGEGLAGIQIQAVSNRPGGDAVWTIADGGVPVGRGCRNAGATYLMLQNLQGAGNAPISAEPPARQAARAIEQIGRILEENGASFREVARTWFYLKDILSWYGDFNRERNARYEAFGIAPAVSAGGLLLPASTGIGGANPAGAACAVDVLAIIPSESGLPDITRLSNPGQREAFKYGSAFARGALFRTPDRNFLQLSGTAAIDEQGRSLHPGDFEAQLRATFDKIDALLSPHGAALADADAATVFVKRPEFAERFFDIAEERGFGDLPGVCVVADICRDDLLVEIDAELSFAPGRP